MGAPRQSQLRKTGGHLPNDIANILQSKLTDTFGGGITVWEQGNLISVPYLKTKAKDEFSHIWTMVRVLQHEAPQEWQES